MIFEHPAALLGLSALPLLVLLSASRLRGAVRALVAGGLVFAIAGPAVDRESRSVGAVVLARDVSLSMRPAERAACPTGDAVEFEDPAEGIARASARAGAGGAVVLATDARWSP
ncbi:MAG: hypothetical protein HUU15_11555, partial [Candidatus Brocadiae bacterium]|nr:hypothetical protein [Candidatus Brocadiia bacterium]